MPELVERVAVLESKVQSHEDRLDGHQAALEDHGTYITGMRATSRVWSSIGGFVGALIGGILLLLFQWVNGR